MTQLLRIPQLFLLGHLALSAAGSAAQEATTTDSLATTTTAVQQAANQKLGERPVREVAQDAWILFNVELAPFCPEQPPLAGNAAEYYVQAFNIWLELAGKIDNQTLNSPQRLELMPEMVQAIDFIEQGTKRRACDFYEFYSFSPSAYFQERPDSVGTLMLTKLLIRRSERLQQERQYGAALRPAKCCVIFGAHLYQTAENHTQATIALQIMTAGFTLIRDVFRQMGLAPEALFASQLQEHYRLIFNEHVDNKTSLRYGLPYHLNSVLEALDSPLPAVRCEGLRVLGNVVDPLVKPSYLVDPNYLILRQRVAQLRPNLINLMTAMTGDADPRVARLAGEIAVLLGQPAGASTTADDDRTTTNTMNLLQRALNFSLSDFLKKIKK